MPTTMCPTTLFDAFTERDETLRGYAESPFKYLNRTGRSYAPHVRSLLDGWFQGFPASEQKDVRARFRSRQESQFYAAYFELLLHKLLRRLGASSIQPHARTRTSNRIDFLPTFPTEGRVYVEATHAANESDEAVAARARLDRLYDRIDSLDFPLLGLDVHLRGALGSDPPSRAWQPQLRAFLSGINPEALERTLSAGGSSPSWTFRHAGLTLVFRAIPRVRSRPERVRGTGRLILIRSYGIQRDTSNETIRACILEKVSRYGVLDAPYVIAVSARNCHLGPSDLMQVFFGDEVASYSVGPRGEWSAPRWGYAGNGVWNARHRERVSAVLVVNPAEPAMIPRAKVWLFHNPFATIPYRGVLGRLPQAIPLPSGEMEWRDGEGLGTILGLATEWPDL